ncbi:unnamed protein product, partial [Meganyctiphanes norvegica]
FSSVSSMSVERKSSLAYQILLYLNGWYLAAFVVLEVCIFIFKTQILPYPSGNIASEVLLLMFFTAVEAIRIVLGKRGNLTERLMGITLAIIFTVPSVLTLLYLLLWQTYVLRIEMILVSIELGFHSLELVFAILTIIRLSKSS